MKPDGTGKCPEHGEVLAAYSFLDLLEEEKYPPFENNEELPDVGGEPID